MNFGALAGRLHRFGFLLIGAAVFLSTIVALTYTNFDSRRFVPSSSHVQTSSAEGHAARHGLNSTKEERDALRQAFLNQTHKPDLKVNNHGFVFKGGLASNLSTNARWTKPMGKNLCIIDLDNRPFKSPYQVFGSKLMSWDHWKEVHGLSVGLINHWLYAKIHGYKYYYIHIDAYKDRRASWKKASVMSHILKKHDACIYLDSDAIFDNLSLPFESLMNYWNLHPDSNSLALAVDPNLPHNLDKFGKIYLNTGFIIAQNNKKTFEILEAWDVCPEEGGQHPGCTKFRLAQPGSVTDQGGFGTYIRYDFPGDIRELPCAEANGYPSSQTECHGKFIKHLWTGKELWIKHFVAKQLPGDLLTLFHEQFLDEKDDFFLEEQQLFAQVNPGRGGNGRPGLGAKAVRYSA